VLQVSVFSVVLWITALVSWAGAYGAWQRRQTRSAIPLLLLMAGNGLWAFAQGTRISVSDMSWQMEWFRIQWIASILAPNLWFAFLMSFIGFDHWLRRWRLALLLEPLLASMLVMSNDALRLLWTLSPEIHKSSDLIVYYWPRGMFYPVVVVYSYALFMSSLLLLIRAIWQAKGLYRQQLILIFVGVLIPLVGNMAQVIAPVSKLFDITTVLFLFSSILYLWAMFGRRLLEIVPIARNTLIDNLQDGMIVVDRMQRVVDTNPSALRFLGSRQNRSTLVGQPIQDVLPDWMREIWTLESASASVHNRTVNGYVDGKPGFITLLFSPIYEKQNDELAGWALTLRDVTLEQQAIAEREQMREQEMEIMLEKERIHLLNQFIQHAAHEFRTPLTVINSSAALLERIEDADRRRKKAQTIQAQVQRTSKLVDMLLKMVNLESDAPEARVSVNVSQLVEGVCQHIRVKYGDRPLLEWQQPPQPLRVKGNATQLLEAITQILDNAYRFTPPEGTIAVRVLSQSEKVVIEVQDTGLGIHESDIPRVFETFWRQDEAHSTPGFGLGLTIAHRIVQMHDGDIEVKSQMGQGSLFRIILPQWIELQKTAVVRQG
jgi:PAS domain S-box-containing protein